MIAFVWEICNGEKGKESEMSFFQIIKGEVKT